MTTTLGQCAVAPASPWSPGDHHRRLKGKGEGSQIGKKQVAYNIQDLTVAIELHGR